LYDLDPSPDCICLDVIPAEQNVKLDEEDLEELDHEADKDKGPEKQ